MDQVTHICDRNNCNPKAVSGPKISCAKCRKNCFLLCFGFAKLGEALKIELPSGCSISIDPKSMCFTCPSCDALFLTDAINSKMEPSINETKNDNTNRTHTSTNENVYKTPVKTNKNPTDTPITFAQLKSDVSHMSRIVSSILKAVDANTTDLCDLKSMCSDTNTIVKSLNANSNEISTNFASKLNEIAKQKSLPSTKSSSSSNSLPQTPSKPTSFANILKQQRTQQINENRKTANKRGRDGTNLNNNNSKTTASTKPIDIPPVKMGKRAGCVTLAVAPAPVKTIRQRKPTDEQVDEQSKKPVFDKSLYVSRIATTVNVNDMNEFIAKESALVPNLDFKCMRLVKKDQDIAALSFISFKIDYIEAKCVVLTEEDFWPSGVTIRPFIPSRTLGNFIPSPGSSNDRPVKILKTSDTKNVSAPAVFEQQTSVTQTAVHEQSSTDQVTIETPQSITKSNESIDLTSSSLMETQ